MTRVPRTAPMAMVIPEVALCAAFAAADERASLMGTRHLLSIVNSLLVAFQIALTLEAVSAGGAGERSEVHVSVDDMALQRDPSVTCNAAD